jgi:hypothetical protein
MKQGGPCQIKRSSPRAHLQQALEVVRRSMLLLVLVEQAFKVRHLA